MGAILIIIIAVIIVISAKKMKLSRKASPPRPYSFTPPTDIEDIQNESLKACTYTKKPLITETERHFFDAIRKSVGNSYIVIPQINLASVIKKQGDFRYQNELYRNIDFGIFDENYNVVLLIEINDESHNDYNRKKRDEKVKGILSNANIPLVTFHTKFGVRQEYISKRIYENLPQRSSEI